MKWFGKVVSQTNLGYRWGFRFIEDNKVIPVLRHGLFERFEGPGHFWISPYESLLAPVHIGFRNATFQVDSVTTTERIPHRINITVTYMVDPRKARAEVQAGLARMTPHRLQHMIENHLDNALRLIVGQMTAAELVKPAMKLRIEHSLFRRLTTDFRWAGVKFLEEELIMKAVKPAAFHQKTLLHKADLSELIKLIENSEDLEKIKQVAEVHRLYDRGLHNGTVHIHEHEPLRQAPKDQNKRENPPNDDHLLGPLFRDRNSTITEPVKH